MVRGTRSNPSIEQLFSATTPDETATTIRTLRAAQLQVTLDIFGRSLSRSWSRPPIGGSGPARAVNTGLTKCRSNGRQNQRRPKNYSLLSTSDGTVAADMRAAISGWMDCSPSGSRRAVRQGNWLPEGEVENKGSYDAYVENFHPCFFHSPFKSLNGLDGTMKISAVQCSMFFSRTIYSSSINDSGAGLFPQRSTIPRGYIRCGLRKTEVLFREEIPSNAATIKIWLPTTSSARNSTSWNLLSIAIQNSLERQSNKVLDAYKPSFVRLRCEDALSLSLPSSPGRQRDSHPIGLRDRLRVLSTLRRPQIAA